MALFDEFSTAMWHQSENMIVMQLRWIFKQIRSAILLSIGPFFPLIFFWLLCECKKRQLRYGLDRNLLLFCGPYFK
jgi:hypothetical protein